MQAQQAVHARLVVFPIQSAQDVLLVRDEKHCAGWRWNTFDKEAVAVHRDPP
jgi:hypothetical protein